MRGVCAVLLLLAVFTQARVHSHINKKNTKASSLEENHVVDVNSHYHVNTFPDVTQNVQELPEQTLPVRDRVMELEEDEDEDENRSDPTRSIQEIPEQTLSEPQDTQKNTKSDLDLDLERVSTHSHKSHSKRKHIETQISHAKRHHSKHYGNLEEIDTALIITCGLSLKKVYATEDDKYNGKECDLKHMAPCRCFTWPQCRTMLHQVLPELPKLFQQMGIPIPNAVDKIVSVLKAIEGSCEAKYAPAPAPAPAPKVNKAPVRNEQPELPKHPATIEEDSDDASAKHPSISVDDNEPDGTVITQINQPNEEVEAAPAQVLPAHHDTFTNSIHSIEGAKVETERHHERMEHREQREQREQSAPAIDPQDMLHHVIYEVHNLGPQVTSTKDDSEVDDDPNTFDVNSNSATDDDPATIAGGEDKTPVESQVETPESQVEPPVEQRNEIAPVVDDNSRLSREVAHEQSVAKGEAHTMQGEDGYFRSTYKNPLLNNPKPGVDPVTTEHRVGLDKADEKGRVELDAGDFHFDIRNNNGQNFLDANRVQIGTAHLGSRPHEKGDTVAKYRIRFANPFVRRPIVIVTTVPSNAQLVDSLGVHPDIFAASVAEIRLDSFIVNVVRLDSLPNNSWGQQLFLDWIAMEYDSEYPKAAPPMSSANFPQPPMTSLEESQANGSVEGELLTN